MNSKALVILILFFIWGTGSTYWYVCEIKGLCENQPVQASVPSGKPVEKPVTSLKPERELLSYDPSSKQPVISDTLRWRHTIEQWKNEIESGKKIIISAPYYPAEPTPAGFENMGLARAFEIKKNLAGYLDTTRVEIRAKSMQGEIPSVINGYEGYFKFHTDNTFVREKDNKTLIYFPYNSDKEIKNPQILSYLDQLAAKLKANSALHVEITGHTDNTGTPESNRWLGRKRAERIKKILISKGVPAKQITVRSAGDTQPVAGNSTREGRKLNRRVEIKIY
jgi:outer membrane protein OmpA-like peptidoglycan-associated protein